MREVSKILSKEWKKNKEKIMEIIDKGIKEFEKNENWFLQNGGIMYKDNSKIFRKIYLSGKEVIKGELVEINEILILNEGKVVQKAIDIVNKERVDENNEMILRGKWFFEQWKYYWENNYSQYNVEWGNIEELPLV